SRQGRDDGSRDGKVSRTKRQEPGCEIIRQTNGHRSQQGERRAEVDRREKRCETCNQRAQFKMELGQGLHGDDGQGPRKGSRRISGGSKNRERSRREKICRGYGQGGPGTS